MDKEMKAKDMQELSMNELEKVPGGIYYNYVGRCKYCKAKTEGKWDSERQSLVCTSCNMPLKSVGIGPKVQTVV